ELLEVNGLSNVAVRSQVVTGNEVALLVRRGENHDWERARARVCPDPTEHLQPVDLRKFQIQQDELDIGDWPRAIPENAVQRLLAVPRDDQLIDHSALFE